MICYNTTLINLVVDIDVVGLRSEDPALLCTMRDCGSDQGREALQGSSLALLQVQERLQP
ncbi:hypothetical protein DPMN_009101 [Dreissena polymorpha]|uniref:Uncharacterized protein n=1 Tax=Dreissena polymorpha TaxID=45954 RepID=A0A9D4MWB4_DREPO|nr:hypothetical protein DPMN_009101 [Dreissena polymorpha]